MTPEEKLVDLAFEIVQPIAKQSVTEWAEANAYLSERGLVKSGEREQIEKELLAEIDAVIHEQEAAPPMALKTLVEDVYADVPYHLRRQYNEFITVAEKLGHAQPGDGAFPL